mmetsp:Transcript_28824/g.59989  ORF Transcript_28824/g.59989 Transcript_28824/m.59989 type:complete len:405 (+) Transcript_28824:889-2103(+)
MICIDFRRIGKTHEATKLPIDASINLRVFFDHFVVSFRRAHPRHRCQIHSCLCFVGMKHNCPMAVVLIDDSCTHRIIFRGRMKVQSFQQPRSSFRLRSGSQIELPNGHTSPHSILRLKIPRRRRWIHTTNSGHEIPTVVPREDIIRPRRCQTRLSLVFPHGILSILFLLLFILFPLLIVSILPVSPTATLSLLILIVPSTPPKPLLFHPLPLIHPHHMTPNPSSIPMKILALQILPPKLLLRQLQGHLLLIRLMHRRIHQKDLTNFLHSQVDYPPISRGRLPLLSVFLIVLLPRGRFSPAPSSASSTVTTHSEIETRFDIRTHAGIHLPGDFGVFVGHQSGVRFPKVVFGEGVGVDYQEAVLGAEGRVGGEKGGAGGDEGEGVGGDVGGGRGGGGFRRGVGGGG